MHYYEDKKNARTSGKHSWFVWCSPPHPSRCVSFPIRHNSKRQYVVVIRALGLAVAIRMTVDRPFTLEQECGWRCCFSIDLWRCWSMKTLANCQCHGTSRTKRPAVEPRVTKIQTCICHSQLFHLLSWTFCHRCPLSIDLSDGRIGLVLNILYSSQVLCIVQSWNLNRTFVRTISISLGCMKA